MEYNTRFKVNFFIVKLKILAIAFKNFVRLAFFWICASQAIESVALVCCLHRKLSLNAY